MPGTPISDGMLNAWLSLHGPDVVLYLSLGAVLTGLCIALAVCIQAWTEGEPEHHAKGVAFRPEGRRPPPSRRWQQR
jgi:hypothetical protein